jgi:hypothetical protein
MGKIASHVLSGIAGGIAVLAAALAIVSYRSPSSFPIVEGIDITVCQPSESPDVATQQKFLNELEAHNHQVIFIKDLTIYNFSCFGEPRPNNAERAKEARSNESFEFVESDLKMMDDGTFGGKSITIGFRKIGDSDRSLSRTLLIVGVPNKEHYFSDTGCGENCLGAYGLYKVTFDDNEGFAFYRLTPFPATTAILDAYQCTLNKISAKGIWQKFSACRF